MAEIPSEHFLAGARAAGEGLFPMPADSVVWPSWQRSRLVDLSELRSWERAEWTRGFDRAFDIYVRTGHYPYVPTKPIAHSRCTHGHRLGLPWGGCTVCKP